MLAHATLVNPMQVRTQAQPVNFPTLSIPTGSHLDCDGILMLVVEHSEKEDDYIDYESDSYDGNKSSLQQKFVSSMLEASMRF